MIISTIQLRHYNGRDGLFLLVFFFCTLNGLYQFDFSYQRKDSTLPHSCHIVNCIVGLALYTHSKKFRCMTLNHFKIRFQLLLKYKYNVHIYLKNVRFPIQWWVKNIFCDYQPLNEHTPYFKSRKKWLLKNAHLR